MKKILLIFAIVLIFCSCGRHSQSSKKIDVSGHTFYKVRDKNCVEWIFFTKTSGKVLLYSLEKRENGETEYLSDIKLQYRQNKDSVIIENNFTTTLFKVGLVGENSISDVNGKGNWIIEEDFLSAPNDNQNSIKSINPELASILIGANDLAEKLNNAIEANPTFNNAIKELDNAANKLF